jgi:hypothetical protein
MYKRIIDQFHFLFGLPFILVYLVYYCLKINRSISWWLAESLYIIFTYNIVEQSLHRLLHSPWSGPFHTSHMRHHKLDPNEFNKRHSTIDYTILPYGAIGFGIFPFLCCLIGFHDSDNGMLIYYSYLSMAIMSFWIHDHYHQEEQNSLFERFSFFRNRRAHHTVHHFSSSSNMSIGALFMPLFILRYMNRLGNHSSYSSSSSPSSTSSSTSSSPSPSTSTSYSSPVPACGQK